VKEQSTLYKINRYINDIHQMTFSIGANALKIEIETQTTENFDE